MTALSTRSRLAGADPDLLEILLQRAASLARPGVVAIPRVSGLQGLVLGRAVYRLALEGGPWVPLVQLEGADEPERAIADAVCLAGPGWVHLAGEGVWPDLRRYASARFLVHSAEIRTSPAVRLLEWLDLHHAVAIDPALARVREALLAWCAQGEIVHLQGPVGSGRAALVRWAHAMCGEGPLEVVEPESEAVAEPYRWLLAREVDELDPVRLEPLFQKLRASAPPNAPPVVSALGRPARPELDRLVGEDPSFCAVLHEIVDVAGSGQPVLVLGETGTGKDPVCQAIHELSRRSGPFVALDLSARSANLLDDDLFGHVPGAFEGARESREGAVRRAHRGTLFLDEIANLTDAAQKKLLRVLNDGQVQPLGSDHLHRVDVRVVAATNVDLEGLVRAGEFRRDLFHRLAERIVRLPPLRQRPSDIARLARHFLGGQELPERVLRGLQSHDWPGNVRELRGAAQTLGSSPSAADRLLARLATRAPALITSSRPLAVRPGWTSRQVRSATTLSLQVPPLAERGEASVRAAILHALAGRPVRAEALERLAGLPWFGHADELVRRLRALPPSGPVDLDMLSTCFPGPDLPRAEPIVVVLHPVLDGERVIGPRSEHAEVGLVVGRLERVADLQRHGARVPHVRAWIARRLGEAVPAFLPFPHLLTLSRAHLLVSRSPQGLVVELAPGVHLPARAVTSEGSVALAPGEPHCVGEIARVWVGQLFDLVVALGPQSFRTGARSLVEMRDSDAQSTLGLETDRRVYPLEPVEIEILTEIVVGYLAVGGSFASHLRTQLAQAGSAAAKLRHYLDVPSATQQCGRLYKFEANGPLREALGIAIGQRGLRADRLPDELKRIVWSARPVTVSKQG